MEITIGEYITTEGSHKDRMIICVFLLHSDESLSASCLQDGRLKVGDRIVAVGDEPVAKLSVDKVKTLPHTHTSTHTVNVHFDAMLI